ncbi:hypothetical protein QFC21_000862 [Naganishia friedmannii]|uniref:Uncharacterized protein n=1 Tax=Naganishia friedmannii TaxID=89922 RepID=A0ACC2W8I0_9TREE|nr:hypothetical protein QFC21_000862 [Naganishia friedmannii]
MSVSDVTQTRLIQGTGIALSGFLTGYITLFSVIDRQALLTAPTTETAKLWQHVYNIGKTTAPPMAIVAGGIFGYLAYRAPNRDLARLYGAAAAIIPSIAPFTIFVMKATNDALHAAADKGATESQQIHALLDHWWKLNAVRALLVGTGTVLGVLASVRVAVSTVRL